MKSLANLVFLVVAAASLADGEEEVLTTHGKDIMFQCSKELGLDLKQNDLEKTPEFKCLFKCMLEKDGILKDGVFSEDQIMKVVKEDKDLDATEKKKIIKAVPKCWEEFKKTPDLCEKSFELTDCVFKGTI